MQHRLLPAVLVAVLALALAACGGDDEPSGAPETGPGALTTVPDVDGLELAEAAEALAAEGLRAAVEYLPSDRRAGTTFGQAPPAGTELQRGESVNVSVSRGSGQPTLVRVPNALDQSAAEATATLEAARFEVLTIPVAAVAEDVVIAHSPAAGAQAPRGALVVVYAGGG
jgi:beta-lactam-binding protein with PASTA domain